MIRRSQTDLEEVNYLGFPLVPCLEMCLKDNKETKVGGDSILLAPSEYLFEESIRKIIWRGRYVGTYDK